MYEEKLSSSISNKNIKTIRNLWFKVITMVIHINGISLWRMRATDGGKYRRRNAERRPFRGTEAPITCVHNVEILTRFTWTLAVHASRIPHGIPSPRERHGDAGWKVGGRRKEEEGEGGRNTKNDRTLYPHLAYGVPRHRRALVESCHLSWNSWGQVAFEWVVFRVRRTRSNSTKRVLSTYSK